MRMPVSEARSIVRLVVSSTWSEGIPVQAEDSFANYTNVVAYVKQVRKSIQCCLVT